MSSPSSIRRYSPFELDSPRQSLSGRETTILGIISNRGTPLSPSSGPTSGKLIEMFEQLSRSHPKTTNKSAENSQTSTTGT